MRTFVTPLQAVAMKSFGDEAIASLDIVAKVDAARLRNSVQSGNLSIRARVVEW